MSFNVPAFAKARETINYLYLCIQRLGGYKVTKETGGSSGPSERILDKEFVEFICYGLTLIKWITQYLSLHSK